MNVCLTLGGLDGLNVNGNNQVLLCLFISFIFCDVFL